ncbi:hypothetical protein [Prosthecobacter sp.]|uniref:hypothetical protein n=1 Tax=Prosthecobacter sp. TaxID=1965333 RepID=UPI003783FCD6
MTPFKPWTESQIVHGLEAYCGYLPDERVLVVTVTHGDRGGPSSVVFEVNGRPPTAFFTQGKVFVYKNDKMNLLQYEPGIVRSGKNYELAWQIYNYATNCLKATPRKKDPMLTT